MKKTVHFVSGLPFSGSTLLCNLLSQNPLVHATGSSGMHMLGHNARNYFDSEEFKSLPDPSQGVRLYENFVRAGIENAYEGITPRPIVVDKSRAWIGYLDSLFRLFPEAKIIVPVRDIRGVVSSFERKFRKNPHCIHGIEKASPANWTTPERRVKSILENPPVSVAIERVHASQRFSDKILYVHFEDLTSDPETTMSVVWEYLGVEPPRHDFNNVKQYTDEIEVAYPYGDHTIRSSVQPVPERWHDYYDPSLSSMISSNFNWINKL